MKKAYNNFDEYIPRESPANVDKWLRALREIQGQQNSGMPYFQAYQQATKGWDSKEIREFQQWVKFYSEQGHMKYTTAQLYGYEGYYLPTARPAVPAPVVSPAKEEQDRQEADDFAAAEAQRVATEKQKKERLADHRKKLLSRLQSARKLFTHDDGKLLAGENLNRFLDMLHEIEKQVHGLQASASVINTLIKRQAGILRHEGAFRSSAAMLSFADNLPGGLPPADPNASAPSGGALGNNTPSMAPPPAAAEEDPEEQPASAANPALLQFLRGLNGENPFEDNTDADDGEDEVEIDEQEADDLMVVEAQEAPVAPPVPASEPAPEASVAAPPPEAPEAPAASTDELTVEEGDLPPSKDFDSLIDAAFSNLKVADIVKRLDDLSRIFKNREIARQLSIVDMMMDQLGLSSFFPKLAEATRSALESNQYCLVRIDEVKDALAGAINTVGKSPHDVNGEGAEIQDGGIDLMGEDKSPDDPLLDQLKTTLDSQQKKEKLKKDLRKSVEDKALIDAGNKQQAQVEDISNELNKENVKVPEAPPTVPAARPASPQ